MTVHSLQFKLSLLIALLISLNLSAQYKVSGIVTSQNTGKALNEVLILSSEGGTLAVSNEKGFYEFETSKKTLTVLVYSEEFRLYEKQLTLTANFKLDIALQSFDEQLTEVVVKARKKRIFELKHLKDVVGTSIFAGKKTEVVLVDQSSANLATNNARQIFSQVAGLNIFENDDAGLQLNIGGRGLDPNRTSNFNTRQNGYDISADVLGYPESYYAPASEGLQEIQVLRGAASLQYGTQFGGLVNFIIKKPNPNKVFEITTRNTVGSNNLFTNFTSISGTKNKLSYYGYYNYKQGDGFRANSQFDSKNVFAHLGYQLNDKTKLEAEFTYLNYLAKQAGGLTDTQFELDPFQSTRARNWFKVDWLLYNFKLNHKFTENTRLSFNFFGLNATRKAVGYRDSGADDPANPRELLIGEFNNFGFETRFVDKYNLFNKKATYLLGVKFYKADNSDFQGAGTAGEKADFTRASDDFPNYRLQGEFDNPNLNVAAFGENIWYVSDKFSITPGFRFEYIKTESHGDSRRINEDAAGNPIGVDQRRIDDINERSFVLFGVGASYKPNTNIEIYANVSQNYRSITFSDVNIVNPNNGSDPNLKDETGFTIDLGARGNYNNWLSYDVGAFALFYNDKISSYLTELPLTRRVGLLRTNAGDARVLGIESLFDVNLKKIIDWDNDFSFNYFINTSVITSEYTKSKLTNVEGKKVEFVPELNLKTGLRFGYKNFSSSLQYSYLSEQFTDVQNTISSSSSAGIDGIVPAYDILDFSASYKYKFAKLEAGVNNLLDNSYFTRRATGYPGPGIIPSAPRNWYVTLELKF